MSARATGDGDGAIHDSSSTIIDLVQELKDYKSKLKMATSELALTRQENEVLKTRLKVKSIKSVEASRSNPSSPLTLVHSSLNSETVHPFEILPPEMWLKVFEHVKDGKDLLNCYHNSKAWRDLLKSSRTLFLFSEVLSILLARNIAVESILIYRLVCQSWKKSVDDILQHHSSHYSSKRQYYYYRLIDKNHITWNKFILKIEQQQDFEIFYRKVTANPHYRNPFLCRYVVLAPHAFNCNYENLLGFLQLYGKHIWYCDIHCCVSLLSFYKKLHKCLELLSNLKVLKISNMGSSDYYSKRKLNRLEWLILHKPLPKLEKLVVLSTYCVPSPLLNAALANYRSLEKLGVEKKHAKNFRFDPSIYLHRLTELTTNLPLCHQLDLLTLKSVQWSLHSLNLCCSPEEFTELQSVFQTITESRFVSTLRTLKLSVYMYWRDNDIPSWPSNKLDLRLPLLENFEFDAPIYCPGIGALWADLALPLISLQDLRLRITHDALLNDTVQILQLYGYFHRMYESNIWELLPRLRSISLEIGEAQMIREGTVMYKYNRDCWEYYCSHRTLIH